MTKLLDRHYEKLKDLCKRYRVQRLEVFGSATSERFNDQSDVDFLVDLQPMPPVEHADAYFSLLEELQVLFGRKVDLVEIGAVKNPFFLRSVNETRQLVYAA
jgi:predicted nucleotidyltransferase